MSANAYAPTTNEGSSIPAQTPTEMTTEEKELAQIITNGDLEGLRSVFETEANIENAVGINFSPLYLAVEKGHFKLAKYMTQLSSADLDTLSVEAQQTPLHWYCLR